MGKKIKRNKKLVVGSNRELVTLEETADYLRVRINQVRIWIKEGFIKTTQTCIEQKGHLRSRTLIVRQSVRDFLKAGNR